jgi:hypothetical protein
VTNVADLLLALGMEVDAADGSFYLIEANVIEPFETGARNSSHAMIRDQKTLLPPHEDVLSLREIPVREIGLLCLLRERSPRGKSSPMCHIRLLSSTPSFMSCLESVFSSDDLAFEECRQCGMVLSQTCPPDMNSY